MNAANNGMMRNIYQNSSRQYQYPTSAINNQINGIGRYATAAQMSTMSSMAAAAAAVPYSSMAAQFSSMPNATGANMNIRQVKSKLFKITKKYNKNDSWLMWAPQKNEHLLKWFILRVT